MLQMFGKWFRHKKKTRKVLEILKTILGHGNQTNMILNFVKTLYQV